MGGRVDGERHLGTDENATRVEQAIGEDLAGLQSLGK